jgi:16S rRNA (guanine966-N2)-methyltransferase
MRITGGQAKGRRLIGPKGFYLRPTSDLVREALFQILQIRLEFQWESCNVLDLFAGTGALGIEALSRSVRQVVFVDHSKVSLDLIRRNLNLCDFSERGKIFRADISNSKSLNLVLKNGPFNLIFADPPYSKGWSIKVLEWATNTFALTSGGWMIIEKFKGEGLPEAIISKSVLEKRGQRIKICLHLLDSRTYGQTQLCFYRSIYNAATTS